MSRSMAWFLQKHELFLFLIVILSPLFKSVSVSGHGNSTAVPEQIGVNVGVVIDLGSQTGKNVHDCISMAISDYYGLRLDLKARLVLHTRDSSNGSALDLLEKAKLQALIIGPENNILDTKSLGALANKAKVPVFSFTSTFSSPDEYPFLVQINQDQTLQFKAIADIVGFYEWKTVSLIFEDTEDGKESIPYIIRPLQESGVRVTHRTPISPFYTDDQILEELHKLAISQQNVFIIHLSPSVAYRLFSTAKKLGMMEQGYAWIMTDKALNQLQSMDEEIYLAMQGVVGLKAYVPSSTKLQDFRLRWKKEFYNKNSFVETRDPDVMCIWAYDTVWAIFESLENLGHEYYTDADEIAREEFLSGEELLHGIERTRFVGLSGGFQIRGGRIVSEAFEVVNVIGKGERSIGLWSSEHEMVKGRSLSVSGSSPKNNIVGLDLHEAIIWPGITTVAPKGRLMSTSGKKLRIAVVDNVGFGQFSSVKWNVSDNTTAIIMGFSIDVFHKALELLEYPVDYEFVPYIDQDGKNLGSYADLVNEVHFQNYDGIVGDVSITVNRTKLVDFTVTYSDVGLGKIVKRDNKYDIWLFSRPFHPYLWLMLTGFLVLTGLAVWAIEHSSDNTEFVEGSVHYQIGTALWFGCSTLFYAQSEKLKSNWSRLIVIVWLFSVFILQSSYTATLSSMLTMQQFQLESTREYVGTHNNSFISGTITRNLNYTDDRLRVYKTCEEYVDALSEGKVGAIVDEIPYLKFCLAKYRAKYAIVELKSDTNGFGFAFQKPYAGLVSDLSKAIIKLREYGKLAPLEDL